MDWLEESFRKLMLKFLEHFVCFWDKLLGFVYFISLQCVIEEDQLIKKDVFESIDGLKIL